LTCKHLEAPTIYLTTQNGEVIHLANLSQLDFKKMQQVSIYILSIHHSTSPIQKEDEQRCKTFHVCVFS